MWKNKVRNSTSVECTPDAKTRVLPYTINNDKIELVRVGAQPWNQAGRVTVVEPTWAQSHRRESVALKECSRRIIKGHYGSLLAPAAGRARKLANAFHRPAGARIQAGDNMQHFQESLPEFCTASRGRVPRKLTCLMSSGQESLFMVRISTRWTRRRHGTAPKATQPICQRILTCGRFRRQNQIAGSHRAAYMSSGLALWPRSKWLGSP